MSKMIQLYRDGSLTPIVLQQASGVRITQSGSAIAGTMQTATTTAAALNMGSVSTPREATFEVEGTIGGTNYVMLGWDDTGSFVEAVRLQPGVPYNIGLAPSITYQIKSATGDVPLIYQVLEA